MSSRRFFISSPPISGCAQITGSEAHHLADVLRAWPSERVEMIDLQGAVWQGVITSIEPGLIRLNQVEILHRAKQNNCRMILAQSLGKPDKLELIFQKTTELGVDEIYLLEAERSILKVTAEKAAAKMERWEKILLSATKQCRRASIPVLHSPLRCRDFPRQAPKGFRLILSEHEGDGIKSLLRNQSPPAVIYTVGPEGGWTSQEETSFREAGFHAVSLGNNILRTETAAIAGLVILQYELNIT